MNAEIEKKIGQNIRELREKAGLTQDQLSARMQTLGCDVTRSALAKIEVGPRHMYPDEAIAVKTALRVKYDELFALDGLEEAFENE